MLNAKLLLLLALAGAASAGRLHDTAYGKQAVEIYSGRHLLDDDECPEGKWAPAPSYGGDSNPDSPSYPPAYGSYGGERDCKPCPPGYTSDGAAEKEDECERCPLGQTSSGLGGGCFKFDWPAMDPSFQRDALIEMLGPDFNAFINMGPASVNEFNQTVAQKLNDYSIAKQVVLFVMKSGSIVTENRMSYLGGESAKEMDMDQETIVNNLQTVFGNSLSKWGVTGFKGTCKGCSYDDGDDDNKALAIGLGVGLGVGIPLIAGIIFFCIWKKRRGEQVVAPQQS